MQKLIFLAAYIFYTSLLCGQSIDKQPKLDTIIYSFKNCIECPLIKETSVYRLLKCGLYVSSNGDIAYRTSEIYNDNFDRRTRYISYIYNADTNDTINAGLKEMKYVIDTASFHFLNYMYWIDKMHVYGYTPMSDGGTIFLHRDADRKSFMVYGKTEYAKDKNHVYYHNSIIEDADSKTFKLINNKEIAGLAFDKNYFYYFGDRLTEKEINEYKLSKYRKKKKQ